MHLFNNNKTCDYYIRVISFVGCSVKHKEKEQNTTRDGERTDEEMLSGLFLISALAKLFQTIVCLLQLVLWWTDDNTEKVGHAEALAW